MATVVDRNTPSPLSVVDVPPPTHHARGARDGVDANATDIAQAPTGVDRDDASSGDLVNEKAPKETLSKRRKVKRHCGKFKWWYLLGTVILLAILLPIFFKVIIPAIVQKIVNEQALPIKSGTFRASTPDELIVSISTSLDTPLGVNIEPLELSLSRPGEDGEEHDPFVKIQLPGRRVDGKTDIIVTNQTVVIDKKDELITWFTEVFDNNEVALNVRGSPKLSLGALNYSPSLKKTLKIPALNALKGFGIQDLRILFSGDDNSTSSRGNLRGKTNLPNSGSLTLGLGNLTLNILAGDIRIGLLTVYDVDLFPGDNIRDFEGELFFSELVPNLMPILDSQKSALTRGMIELQVSGNATVVNGEHIPYVEAVLKDKRIPFEMPVISLLMDVLNSLGGDAGSLLDVFGDVFGNTTLLENALDHWDVSENEKRDGASLRTKLRSSSPRASLAWNMLKLGSRGKK